MHTVVLVFWKFSHNICKLYWIKSRFAKLQVSTGRCYISIVEETIDLNWSQKIAVFAFLCDAFKSYYSLVLCLKYSFLQNLMNWSDFCRMPLPNWHSKNKPLLWPPAFVTSVIIYSAIFRGTYKYIPICSLFSKTIWYMYIYWLSLCIPSW